MKHRPKAKKLITCLLCLTLCCLLALGSLPAQAEEASASPIPAALEEDTSLSSQISEPSPAPSSTEEDPESSAVTAPPPTPSYELILRPWDLAGATVILREAGGICKTVEGDEIDLTKIRSYVCSGGRNLDEFYKIADGIL